MRVLFYVGTPLSTHPIDAETSRPGNLNFSPRLGEAALDFFGQLEAGVERPMDPVVPRKYDWGMILRTFFWG